MYLRLHGEKELYSGSYSEEAISRWAEWRIHGWSIGAEPAQGSRISSSFPLKRANRHVYCYFDNDIKVRAPFDARRLIEKLGLKLDLMPFG